MYTIDQEKLEQVTELYNEVDPRASEYDVKLMVCSWYVEKHQDWIDNSSPREIADWLIARIFG